MRRSADFVRVLSGGARASSRTLVVYALRADDAPTLVGFIVSRAVGNAVTRNRVKRRLRHCARPLAESPTGVGLHAVVRATSAAGSASHARLASDLRRCWVTVQDKVA